MANEWFLDSSYAIALAASSDQLHSRSLQLANDIEESSRHLITTKAVLFEIGNALSKQRYRQAATSLLASISMDPTITVIEISSNIYHTGLSLFSNRPDKEWGLTDCLSFVVMEAHGITEALTADMHFEQAGFHALLRKA